MLLTVEFSNRKCRCSVFTWTVPSENQIPWDVLTFPLWLTTFLPIINNSFIWYFLYSICRKWSHRTSTAYQCHILTLSIMLHITLIQDTYVQSLPTLASKKLQPSEHRNIHSTHKYVLRAFAFAILHFLAL